MAKVTPTAPAAPRATAPAPVGSNPAAPPSAAPGTKEPKAKKEKKDKVKKAWHPALEPDAEGKPTKTIAKIPDDFDPKLHRPFGRKNLEDESLWYEIQARKFEAKAADCRRQGEEAKKLGSVKDKQSAKKLLALQKRIDEVTKTLEGSGVDVAALLAALKAKADEKKPEETAAA